MEEISSTIVPQIELDDYKIKQIIYKQHGNIISTAISKKTGKEVVLKFYNIDTFLNSKERYLIRAVNNSNADVPSIAKIIGYRLPSKDTDNYVTFDDLDDRFRYTAITVMNYYKNGDLGTMRNAYFKSDKPSEILNATIRTKIIFGVASIMKQLHQKKIILRDLIMDHILLDDNLEPVITGFFLSKDISNNVEMTMAIGTPFAMAPELFIDGEQSYSYPVDVYAFAIFVYQMFSSKIEFPGNKPIRSPQQYMMKIGRGMRPVRPENIDDNYWDLIQNCWKQIPDERPTFADIVRALRNDKFALKEFGVMTDLDELHRYQQKIEG